MSSKDELLVEGLDDFLRDLDTVADDYPQAVRDAAAAVAVALTVRAMWRGSRLGGVAGKAAQSLRQRANTVVGGQSAPYFMGAEYGALRYKQFESWRGNQWQGWKGSAGRIIGATIREDQRALIEAFLKNLDDAHSVAFPD